MSLLSKKDKSKNLKKKKFKRKKDIFGKRLFRIWLVVLVFVEAIALAGASYYVKSKQNDKQDVIDKEIVGLEDEIRRLQLLALRKQNTYENIGSLVSTLPSTFDKQTCNVDIDRLLSMSGLVEDSRYTRKVEPDSVSPFTIGVTTVSAAKITLRVQTLNIDYLILFLDVISNYEQENFFFVDNVTYYDDNYGTTSIVLYTFYNKVDVYKK